MPFVDSHAHLDGERMQADLPEILERAFAEGLTHIVCIGASDGFDSNPETLAIIEKDPRLFGTVGIHPHDSRIVDAECLQKVKALASHKKVVAIGETGLDYHYDHSPRKKQREVFGDFLEMARDLQLPVSVHTRDAEDDTISIMKDHDATTIGGVIHCFTGTEKLSSAAIEMGFYVSFSGVITFKNGQGLRDIAKELPRDKVLIETDCPFLTPIPFRGKRNEPSYIKHTAEVLADVWNIPVEEAIQQTGNNAVAMYRLPVTV